MKFRKMGIIMVITVFLLSMLFSAFTAKAYEIEEGTEAVSEVNISESSFEIEERAEPFGEADISEPSFEIEENTETEIDDSSEAIDVDSSMPDEEKVYSDIIEISESDDKESEKIHNIYDYEAGIFEDNINTAIKRPRLLMAGQADESFTVRLDNFVGSLNGASSSGKSSHFVRAEDGGIVYCGTDDVRFAGSNSNGGIAERGQSATLGFSKVETQIIRKILFYGAGGPEDILTGRMNSGDAYQITHFALCLKGLKGTLRNSVGASTITKVNSFISEINALAEPDEGFTALRYTGYGANGVNTSGQDMYTFIYERKTSVTVKKTGNKDCHNELIDNTNYSLEGTVFGIYSDSDCTELIEEIVSDKYGEANASEIYIFGQTIYVKELKAPKGYVTNPNLFRFDITDSTTEFTVSDDPVFDPNVIRIFKRNADTEKPVTGDYAVFRVDYYMNSDDITPARSWHYRTIEGLCELDNEKYLDSDYTNDELYRDTEGNPAFPLGYLKVSEIKAPRGYLYENLFIEGLIEQSGENAELSWIPKGNNSISLLPDGAIGWNNRPVKIRTKAFCSETSTNTGSAALEKVDIRDTVYYENLRSGASYRIRERLIETDTGRLVGELEQDFYIEDGNKGSILMDAVTVATEKLYGKSILITERIYELDGDNEKLIYTHYEPDNRDQTIFFPEIETKAQLDDSKKFFKPLEEMHLKDTVIFRNLLKGESYSLRTVLINKNTGAAVLEKKVELVPVNTDGEYDVSVIYSPESGVNELVFTEYLYLGDTLIAAHEDIEDSEQTVTIYAPEISTKAHINGMKQAVKGEIININDEIMYRGLKADEEYTINTIIVEKRSGKAVKSISEQFIPEGTSGIHNVLLSIETGELNAGEYVIFEEIILDEETVVTHTDLYDEAQTIRIVEEIARTGENEYLLISYITLLAISLIIIAVFTIRAIRERD